MNMILFQRKTERKKIKMINRAIIIVLDSLGIGEAPDADKYGDIGSDTLGHIYKYGNVKLPNLKKLGIYNIDEINIDEKRKVQ